MKSRFLQVAIEAAKKAEGVIMQYYSKDLAWDKKRDNSPVTIADRKAEEVIRNLIAKNFPDHDVIGEELKDKESNAKYKWIIDPIDGTGNYSRKIPLFATQIALMRGNDILLGVSNAPAIKEFVFAEKGSGAFLNDRRIQVSNIKKIEDSNLLFGGLKHFKRTKTLNLIGGLVEKASVGRGFGDAWSYHLLAQGKIDIMVEARIKIWDIAALTLIIQEAGGKATDFSGKPICKIHTSICATNGLLHNEVCKILSEGVK